MYCFPGFRYELYCVTKECQTTQCVVSIIWHLQKLKIKIDQLQNHQSESTKLVPNAQGLIKFYFIYGKKNVDRQYLTVETLSKRQNLP